MNKQVKSGKKSKVEYKAVSQEDVTLIKAMYDAGIGQGKIMKATGRGAGTVVLALKSDGTFKDYHRLQQEQAAKYAVNRAKVEPEVKELELTNPVTGEPLVSKASWKTADTADVVTRDTDVATAKAVKALQMEVTAMRNKLDHITETLDWIAEHAVIETKKKARFF